ncbi:hypothetical protein [Microtetraspora glauca]|uniref:DUF4190 domain-containing protein n=1 Tax=Microtetraspora glauca TaxID=1996 RepID=A0ABV3GML4_MICGL
MTTPENPAWEPARDQRPENETRPDEQRLVLPVNSWDEPDLEGSWWEPSGYREPTPAQPGENRPSAFGEIAGEASRTDDRPVSTPGAGDLSGTSGWGDRSDRRRAEPGEPDLGEWTDCGFSDDLAATDPGYRSWAEPETTWESLKAWAAQDPLASDYPPVARTTPSSERPVTDPGGEGGAASVPPTAIPSQIPPSHIPPSQVPPSHVPPPQAPPSPSPAASPGLPQAPSHIPSQAGPQGPGAYPESSADSSTGSWSDPYAGPQTGAHTTHYPGAHSGPQTGSYASPPMDAPRVSPTGSDDYTVAYPSDIPTPVPLSGWAPPVPPGPFTPPLPAPPAPPTPPTPPTPPAPPRSESPIVSAGGSGVLRDTDAFQSVAQGRPPTTSPVTGADSAICEHCGMPQGTTRSPGVTPGAAGVAATTGPLAQLGLSAGEDRATGNGAGSNGGGHVQVLRTSTQDEPVNWGGGGEDYVRVYGKDSGTQGPEEPQGRPGEPGEGVPGAPRRPEEGRPSSERFGDRIPPGNGGNLAADGGGQPPSGDRPVYPGEPGRYGGGPGYYQQPPKRGGGLGTAAMVLGIVSIVLLFVCGIGTVTAVVGVILGIVALATGSSKSRAVTGIVLSVVTLVLAAVIGVVFYNWFQAKGLGECFDIRTHPTQASTQRCIEEKLSGSALSGLTG